MKSFGLILATVCVVLFLGIVLLQAGVFERRPVVKRDNRAAAQRYGFAQPTHWRYYVLQR